MLPLAHMGIGSKLVNPWAQKLPKWALLAGTLLPDAIDKPLFYILLFESRWRGGNLGFINSSRTIAHTGVFLLAFTLLASVRRSRILAAMALGIATHLLLDNLNDNLVEYFIPDVMHPSQHSALVALLFPFLKPYFPAAPFKSFAGHMDLSLNPLSLGFETVGASILFWDYWQNRHESEILQGLTLRRRRKKELKRRKKHPELR